MRLIDNPPNPFQSRDCDYLEGMTPPAKLQVFEDQTRSILAKNDSPDLGFQWSLNPYRGCAHACAYCYARPSHEYLGFGAGTDFETKIVVKKNAAKLLRAAFMKPSWKGELIVFSGDTDCYQPLESHYQLTRECLEVCLEFGNPVGIITKSSLITRDLNLLERLHERTTLSVMISIPFAEDKTGRVVEPHAALISRRFEILETLARAGLDAGVIVAPIIPGLNDADIPRILKRAKDCGATSAFKTLLRLPGSVRQVFAARIRSAFPLAYEKIMEHIRQTRGGQLSNSEFGKRFQGTGPYWENIEHVFEVYAHKLGFNKHPATAPKRPPFKRPTPQIELVLNLSD